MNGPCGQLGKLQSRKLLQNSTDNTRITNSFLSSLLCSSPFAILNVCFPAYSCRVYLFFFSLNELYVGRKCEVSI